MVVSATIVMVASPTPAQSSPEWQRTAPDFAVYLPTGANDGTNQMINTVETSDGTWIATATMASKEGATNQRVAVFRSTDRGQTWSDPVVIAQQSGDDGLRASWSTALIAPGVGQDGADRTYVFYNKNTGSSTVRADVTGQMRFKYSDDNGQTWQGGDASLPIDMATFADPNEPNADPRWIGVWNPVVTAQNNVIFPFARYRGSSGYSTWETETSFLQFDNILTESDPTKLQVTTQQGGDTPGLRAPKNSGGIWANEPAMVELSDGRLFATMRTQADALYWSVSDDQGQTWTEAEPLRYQDGGGVVENPNAPAPTIKLEDGRIVMMYYNAPMENTFGPRDPAYITVGEEALDKDQPVIFGRPKEFMTVNGTMPEGGTGVYPQSAAYGSFMESDGELVLFYPDSKYYLLGKVVDESFLGFDPFGRIGATFSFEDTRIAADETTNGIPAGWTGGGTFSKGISGDEFANAPGGTVEATPEATDGQRLLRMTATDNVYDPTYFDQILYFGDTEYSSIKILADIGNMDRTDDSGDDDTTFTFGFGYDTDDGYIFLASKEVLLSDIASGQMQLDFEVTLDMTTLDPAVLDEDLSMRFQLVNTSGVASQSLLDNVRLSGVAAPEPTTASFVLSGGALALLKRHRPLKRDSSIRN